MHLRELFAVHLDLLVFIVLSAEPGLKGVARACGVVLSDRLTVAHLNLSLDLYMKEIYFLWIFAVLIMIL
jgi:hypothetical protein